MKGHGSQFPMKKQEGVLALLEEPDLNTAATRVGVSTSTLNRWRQQPEFDQALRDARRDLLDRALLDLRRAGASAVEALTRNLSCGNPNAEIKAAATLMDLLLKVATFEDIESRIAELEHQALRA